MAEDSQLLKPIIQTDTGITYYRVNNTINFGVTDSRLKKLISSMGITGSISYEELLDSQAESGAVTLKHPVTDYAFIVFTVRSDDRGVDVEHEMIPATTVTSKYGTNFAVVNTFFYTLIVNFENDSEMNVIEITGKPCENVSLSSIAGIKL